MVNYYLTKNGFRSFRGLYIHAPNVSEICRNHHIS